MPFYITSKKKQHYSPSPKTISNRSQHTHTYTIRFTHFILFYYSNKNEYLFLFYFCTVQIKKMFIINIKNNKMSCFCRKYIIITKKQRRKKCTWKEKEIIKLHHMFIVLVHISLVYKIQNTVFARHKKTLNRFITHQHCRQKHQQSKKKNKHYGNTRTVTFYITDITHVVE